MKDVLKKLHESGLISETDLASLTNSFEEKVLEAEKAAETRVREELSARYDHDKEQMVEAMDKIVTESLAKQEKSAQAEIEQLIESNKRLRQSIVTMRRENQEKFREQAQALDAFVAEKLQSELEEFQQDRKVVNEMKVKLATQITESKKHFAEKLTEKTKEVDSLVTKKLDESINAMAAEIEKTKQRQLEEEAKTAENLEKLRESYNIKIKAIDQFVVESLRGKVNSLEEESEALSAMRVKMVTEARQQLEEAKLIFVSEAAKAADKLVTEKLKEELAELYGELEESRKNRLGLKIFETFAGVFKQSHYNESDELTALRFEVDDKAGELNKIKSQLAEAKASAIVAKKKAKLVESKAVREATLAELLSPLNRDKRMVMKEMLENVHTSNLRESYNKYLPIVLNEGKQSKRQNVEQLKESTRGDKSTVTITGNQRIENLNESDTKAGAEELDKLLKLAGVMTK